MKFIDLFAGLGGFHIALDKLGHECVFASEIKQGLVGLYEANFKLRPYGDIRKISADEIPPHDILCAGFPCQPFSKAGSQKGLKDENNGNLFMEIVRILKYHRPKYFILENVQHLAKHDNQETYNFMSTVLKDDLGYDIRGEVLSPHDYNIPQHRQRLFIVGCRDGLEHFSWPKKIALERNAYSFLESKPNNAVPLERAKDKCLDIWQEFLDHIPKHDKLPSFPIWSMEFGATYPYENTTPYASDLKILSESKGNFGTSLKDMSREEIFANIPNYARTAQLEFPAWKKNYIRSNREFYENYRSNLEPVIIKIKNLGVPSWQKLEWNVQGGARNVRNYIIQFRGSGIRLKRPDFFPSLVCVSTQIPIIGWQNRYITRQEGAALQGMEDLNCLPENIGSCFDALGNAVNANIVNLIAKSLIKEKKVELTKSKLEEPV
jgi:DNA (cytosine-5)-methyltransferase 1